jgi:hypothetical protein
MYIRYNVSFHYIIYYIYIFVIYIIYKGWDNNTESHPKEIYPQCDDTGADHEIILFPYLSGLEAVAKLIY